MCARSRFLAVAVALLGLGAFVEVSSAASEKELVVVSWGGSTTAAQREAFYTPFEAATGIKIIEDTFPDPIKVRVMVESKNVTWDVVDFPEEDMLSLAKLGFLAPILDKYFDSETKAGLGRDGIRDHGVLEGFTTQLIAWNTTKYNQQTAPKNWKEFWDVKRFPGRRTLNAGTYVIPPIEAALLADGVPPDKLYPLDIDRAFKSLDKIKAHVVKWTTTSPMAVQMLISGEADLVSAGYTRAAKAKLDDKAPIDMHFNESLVQGDFWTIVKGAPHYENALKFIAFASDAKRQAKRAELQRHGPGNRNAFNYLSKELAAILPSYEPHLKISIRYSPEFWSQIKDGKTMKEYVAERWNRWILQ